LEGMRSELVAAGYPVPAVHGPGNWHWW